MVELPQTKPRRVEYPESDGQPMSESDITRDYLIYCVEALRLFFQSRPQVYVSGNLFIYYKEGDASKSLSPDVFVVFGVSKRERRTYKVWQEGGKVPAFVLEITSKTTKQKDEEIKPQLYAQLGISEYFQYDPSGDYLHPQLKGQRLVEGQYVSMETDTLPDGTLSISSQTLGVDLRLLSSDIRTTVGLSPVARSLRLFDPQTGAQLLTYREAEQARQDAEQARQDAEQVATDERKRAESSEQQLATLLEKLKAQGLDPEQFLS
ncbi:MAG: Uma2 family endonuclease [Cyanobacteria bacterium P01_D01_bin.44]